MALTAINLAERTYDHTCAACGHAEPQRPFGTLLTVPTPVGVALGVYCAACGAVEGMDIVRADAEAEAAVGLPIARAEQARLVRAIVRATLAQ
ncbi:MAG TPA: hypothetical protein VGR57_21625 [Ktedonobacterales bacterium]|nr:hypothetical protein [Ktedonobacterales bacterium]